MDLWYLIKSRPREEVDMIMFMHGMHCGERPPTSSYVDYFGEDGECYLWYTELQSGIVMLTEGRIFYKGAAHYTY